MTKRQVRKAAHTSIYKEGKSHNTTFNELRGKAKMDGNALAEIISGIVSREKYEQTKPIWMAYLGVLGVIILLRLFYVYLVFSQLQAAGSVQPIVMLFVVVFSIGVPAFGVYSILTASRSSLYPVAAFLVLGVLRSMRYTSLSLSWDSLIVYGLIAVLIVLTILLWMKWKTPYSKQVEVVSTEDGDKKRLQYTFEESSGSDELLDDLS